MNHTTVENGLQRVNISCKTVPPPPKKKDFLSISHSELNKTCLLSRFTSISFIEAVLLHWLDIVINI